MSNTFVAVEFSWLYAISLILPCETIRVAWAPKRAYHGTSEEKRRLAPADIWIFLVE
ncbi:CPA_1a_G0049330.mRNA.1.CDS.1 [Saccharomyces cerevisiae]|nr:hypothetical protein WN66_05798 [Saccharomyces cerevisiae]CAD6647945.1 SX2_G0032260.mRNA.1.CDS.1 [Saccharomyces cerevisiae]CAI4747009.1 CPA_1a_G0049330.mRNA.1.CDS.1 [Saccharomyces cerevisiae]CAI4778208.1 CQS_1a_G0048810.mRNA.1.CDS.1 [Saccharomyces cerevisiae]CAI5328527.1 ALI_HP2_G0048090.mRNA.1.CDS.1 [Saccharomyces cerevisiae]